jgi:carboxylesterase type B
MQSGPYSPILETVVTARPIVDYLANITHCQENLISCLRNLTADDLMAASLQTNTIFQSPLSTIWAPIVDGVMIKYQLHESIQKERFQNIPLMINTNKDEATFFITALIHKPSDIRLMKSKAFPFLNNFENVLIITLT